MHGRGGHSARTRSNELKDGCDDIEVHQRARRRVTHPERRGAPNKMGLQTPLRGTAPARDVIVGDAVL